MLRRDASAFRVSPRGSDCRRSTRSASGQRLRLHHASAVRPARSWLLPPSNRRAENSLQPRPYTISPFDRPLLTAAGVSPVLSYKKRADRQKIHYAARTWSGLEAPPGLTPSYLTSPTLYLFPIVSCN